MNMGPFDDVFDVLCKIVQAISVYEYFEGLYYRLKKKGNKK